MNRNLLIGLGLFLAVIVVGFFLVKKPAVPQKTQEASPAATSENSSPAAEITVTGTEYSFNPASIIVKKGEKVKLTFVNAGSTIHSLVIDGLDVKTKMISPGKSETIEFVAESDSNLTFYCGVANHREMGMEGEIIIEQ